MTEERHESSTFADRLALLMDERNWSVKDIAGRTHIYYQTFYAWLNGRNMPTLLCLIAIADAFEVSLDYLVGRNDER